jgi:hypothetical protein
MMRESQVVKAVSWLVIGLMLNLSICVSCLAQETPREEVPDSEQEADTATDTVADSVLAEDRLLEPNQDIFPYTVSEDSLIVGAGPESRAVYREWWLWTVAVVVVATTIILYSGGDEHDEDQDLPGFPEPPER